MGYQEEAEEGEAMMDQKLSELSTQLSAARTGRETAQSILDVARKEEHRLSTLVREHMKSTYNVDPWRL